MVIISKPKWKIHYCCLQLAMWSFGCLAEIAETKSAGLWEVSYWTVYNSFIPHKTIGHLDLYVFLHQGSKLQFVSMVIWIWPFVMNNNNSIVMEVFRWSIVCVLLPNYTLSSWLFACDWHIHVQYVTCSVKTTINDIHGRHWKEHVLYKRTTIQKVFCWGPLRFPYFWNLFIYNGKKNYGKPLPSLYHSYL